jgi:putative protease
MECARAAVANGADSVYFGLGQFNARMRADNFTTAQLPELVRFLHEHHVRAIATLNILVFTHELSAAEAELVFLDANGVDAVIVQDLGVAALAQKLGLRMEVHASTQMTITSPTGLRFVRQLGIKRVVVARELSLKELAAFREVAAGSRSHEEIEIEVFVHGALCVAYSGQCLTSEALGQRSANRGECASACRLPYTLIVDGIVKDLGDRRYLLSPQDLAAVHEIPELLRRGVTAFKIEGRLKSPEYVAATTQVYRKAIDAAVAELGLPAMLPA